MDVGPCVTAQQQQRSTKGGAQQWYYSVWQKQQSSNSSSRMAAATAATVTLGCCLVRLTVPKYSYACTTWLTQLHTSLVPPAPPCQVQPHQDHQDVVPGHHEHAGHGQAHTRTVPDLKHQRGAQRASLLWQWRCDLQLAATAASQCRQQVVCCKQQRKRASVIGTAMQPVTGSSSQAYVVWISYVCVAALHSEQHRSGCMRACFLYCIAAGSAIYACLIRDVCCCVLCCACVLLQVYGDPQEHPQTEAYWGNVNCIGERSCYDEGACARFVAPLLGAVSCLLQRI
jgi:hypothetical protein